MRTPAARRTRRGRFGALIVTVVVAASGLAGAGVATPGISVPKGFKLVKRVKLASDVYRYTITGRRIPQQINVVRAPRGSGVELDVAMGRPSLTGPGRVKRRTSAICRTSKCLAGTNGAFFRPSDGASNGAILMDGEPVRSSMSSKPQFLIARDGSARTGAVRLPTTITARYPVMVTLAGLGVEIDRHEEERSLAVEGINVERKRDQVVLYTDRYGKASPRAGKGVHLLARVIEPSGPVRVDRPITLRPEKLRWDGRTKLRRDRVVLAGHGDGADALVRLWRDIKSGRALEDVTLFVRTAPRAWESLAGGPVLVRNGKVHDTRGPGARSRHPRTMLGWNADGDLLMVTVDGRDRRARGMTLAEAATFMRRLGAVGAINLDGGGSTTYVERGKLRNRPSSVLVWRAGKRRVASSARPGERIIRRVERQVPTAVLLVRG